MTAGSGSAEPSALLLPAGLSSPAGREALGLVDSEVPPLPQTRHLAGLLA